MTEFEMLEYDAIERGDEMSLELLADWYEDNGQRFWDGHGYCGRFYGRDYRLEPIEEEDEYGDWEIVGWEIHWI